MTRKYHYVRYTWWAEIDVDELSGRLSTDFETRKINKPESQPYELSLYKELRDEVLVKADTVKAYISGQRAVLFQREQAPLTSRDLELRRRLMEVYPRDRPSPFPWGFSDEESFEVAED